MLMATTSVALNQAIVLNISILNEKLIEAELENKKLLEENINLKVEMKKKRKVDDHLTRLKESIMMEHELLHDAKVECFIRVQNMEDVLKDLEKHMETTSHIY
jgi:hypothetical protein